MAMEYQGSGVGCLPTHSDGSHHRAIYDLGRGAGRCRQFPMVRSLFPCFAEGQGSCTQSTVVMAKGEGTRGRSLPTGQGILGRNRHRAHCLLHKTLLGTSPKGCIQKEGKGAVSHVITFVDDVAVCVPSLNIWDQFVWPLGAAMPWVTTEVEQYGYHRGQAVDLGPVMLATQFRVTE